MNTRKKMIIVKTGTYNVPPTAMRCCGFAPYARG